MVKEFKGKVAVITGAASGIGRAIAERCAHEGMKVVLADIEEDALAHTEAEMGASGATVLAVLTDVSKEKDVEVLAQKTLSAFGATHLLCNNAGVSAAGTPIWESSVDDWRWGLGVNLWGIIHGVRTFVPIMLEQDTEGHIVNTASMAGLMSYPGSGIYRVAKHGVVALSESLYHELVQRDAKIKVSVLCPGFVKTRIMTSRRNRPTGLRNDPVGAKLSREDVKRIRAWRMGVLAGISPAEAADCVVEAIQEERFYIFTHPEMKPLVALRMEDILQERSPTDALADAGWLETVG